MDANALEMMVIPIVAGMGLGTALGMVGLAAMRLIGAVAGLGGPHPEGRRGTGLARRPLRAGPR